MYLYGLMINMGDNPDRPRPGRLWLRNIYHVHQRLCMAFPSEAREKNDREFLQPFKEDDFPLLRNPNAQPKGNPDTKPKDPRYSFLFRIDNSIKDNSPRTMIIVQSEDMPNWDYAFQNAGMLLAAPPQELAPTPPFSTGQEFRFRIRVNLSKKGHASKGGASLRKPREGTDAKGRQKDQGKRISLTWEKGQKPEDVIIPWFANKAWVMLKGENERKQAFELRSCKLQHLGWVVGYKPKPRETKTECEENEVGQPSRQMKFRSALLEGTLKVTDANAFKQVIETGIGPAKAFGFGLLSVAGVK